MYTLQISCLVNIGQWIYQYNLQMSSFYMNLESPLILSQTITSTMPTSYFLISVMIGCTYSRLPCKWNQSIFWSISSIFEPSMIYSLFYSFLFLNSILLLIYKMHYLNLHIFVHFLIEWQFFRYSRYYLYVACVICKYFLHHIAGLSVFLI